LREGRDEIEVEGIRRSRETLEKAELILPFSTRANAHGSRNELSAEFPAKEFYLSEQHDLPKKLELPSPVTHHSSLVPASS